jgi:transcriptional regulator with XRE-family HTH domain
MAIHQILRRQCPALLELGGRVREMRRAAGFTQAALAAPFSAAYISAIEHGIVVPSLSALVVLASRLGVEPAELLAGVNFLVPAAYTEGHDPHTNERHHPGEAGPRGRLRSAPQDCPAARRADPGPPG